jgi:DNA end-binding protein Ku
MRTIWKGHLTFGLISVPVGLYTAIESSERVSFRMLHRKDLSPIQYKKYCSKEDVEVPNDEIVKGYEVDKNKFAVVEDEELEKVQEETAGEEDHTVEVLEFVELSSISPLSFEKPYYLAPEKGGDKAYAVLRDALIEERKVGIAKITIRNRPQLGALVPMEQALCLEILRPFEEIRLDERVEAARFRQKVGGDQDGQNADRPDDDGMGSRRAPQRISPGADQAPLVEEKVRRSQGRFGRRGERRRPDGSLEEERGEGQAANGGAQEGRRGLRIPAA